MTTKNLEVPHRDVSFKHPKHIWIGNSKVVHKHALSSESSVFNQGDNCIQNLYLGWYIVRYMVRNLVLQRHTSEAVKM